MDIIYHQKDLIIFNEDLEIANGNDNYYPVLACYSNETQGDEEINWWSLKKYKSSIINSQASHHKSTGSYYAFGVRAGKIDEKTKLSIQEYATKKRKRIVNDKLDIIDDALIEQIQQTTHFFDTLIPNFSCAVTSVTRVLKNIISNFCGHECEKITTKFRSDKFTSRFVCVDATTGQYHTENDGTWTVIAVPKQNTTKKEKRVFQI